MPSYHTPNQQPYSGKPASSTSRTRCLFPCISRFARPDANAGRSLHCRRWLDVETGAKSMAARDGLWRGKCRKGHADRVLSLPLCSSPSISSGGKLCLRRGRRCEVASAVHVALWDVTPRPGCRAISFTASASGQPVESHMSSHFVTLQVHVHEGHEITLIKSCLSNCEI
jgi:hypothetical protein